MKERDVHKLIEQQNPEAKQRVLERIHARLGIPEAPKRKPVKHLNAGHWAAIAVALVCIVTLSVVLPLTLRDDGSRYCSDENYTSESLGQTLKEYSSEHNKNLLYVDWYGTADEITTKCGRLNANREDIVFIEEMIINSETGEALTLAVTDNKTRVDKFELYYMGGEKIYINNISVKQIVTSQQVTLATFEYQGYVYYLQLDGGGQERLTEIIQDMLK